MNEVYILYEHPTNNSSEVGKIVGVVTKQDVAIRFIQNPIANNCINCYTKIQIDDPELLNRIAKENKS